MPNPNISNFISAFEGGARANRFDVLLSFPSDLASTGTDVTKKLAFTCKGASIPASNIGKVEVPYMSRQIAVAGDRTIDDWTITVINDVKYEVRIAFERWMNAINAHENNTAQTSGWHDPKKYYATAIVTQYSREHDDAPAAISYTMHGIFPTALSDISLGWGDNDSVEEFTVTLACNWWVPNWDTDSDTVGTVTANSAVLSFA